MALNVSTIVNNWFSSIVYSVRFPTLGINPSIFVDTLRMLLPHLMIDGIEQRL